MSTKNILLATRPIVPPWDEASKNFAYFLARSVTNANITLLTTKESVTGLPDTVTQFPLYESSQLGFSAKLALLRYLRDHRRDFDITHYLFTPARRNALIIKNLARPTKGKTIQTVATLREDLYAPQELKALLFADAIVTYTETSKNRLKELGCKNVHRIYPGIDLSLYAPKNKDQDLLDEFHFTKDHFIAMYPGEYSRLGATDMIVESLMHHFNTRPESNLRFIFACRIKNEADVKKKREIYEALKLADLLSKIAFSDTSFDMPALYNIADVVIFPVGNMVGKFDIPLVIIEAYACGKPVILSDLAEFEEFSNEDISVTIPRDSNESLLKALHTLEDDREKRETLGKNARMFVEKNFDLKTTAREYEALYQSL